MCLIYTRATRAYMDYRSSPLLWIMAVLDTLSLALSDVPRPPANLTLTEILSRTAVVTWDADVSDKITLFEMTVRPLSDSPRVVKAHLDGRSRSYLLNSLYPSTEYELFLLAQNMDGVSNISDIITFRTQQANSETFQPNIHPGEVIIVCLILIAWFCAIAMFLHKWGTLRILQAPEPRYNHSPKNIETIKVVKRPTDSIIYKSYSTQLSKTMVARQKRIERMNTMPNIKLNIRELTKTTPRTPETIREQSKETKDEDGGDEMHAETSVPFGHEKKRLHREQNPDERDPERSKPERHKYKVFSRMITSPVLELEEQQSSSS